MVRGHGGCGLRGELVELTGGDALVDAGAHLLGDKHRVTVLVAEPVAQLLEPRRDLVEVDGLVPAVALHHVHLQSFYGEFRRTVGVEASGGGGWGCEERGRRSIADLKI